MPAHDGARTTGQEEGRPVDTKQPKADHLSHEVCWSRVRGAAVGRLAVIVDERPEIFPVNHLVDHASVVFRTSAGTKLAGADGHWVAFECDGVDLDTGAAWSVVLKGRAHVVRRLDELIETLPLQLSPWQPGTKPTFVRIAVDEVSGREFVPTWRQPTP
jgi:nitroimidazol reductase NimA-like FMN-containing flavoprotein (pyridoxamine 5'-phosphate oxidase superfamily)